MNNVWSSGFSPYFGLQQPLRFLQIWLWIADVTPLTTSPQDQLNEFIPGLFAMADEAQNIQAVYHSDLIVQSGGVHPHRHRQQHAFVQRHAQDGHQCYVSAASGFPIVISLLSTANRPLANQVAETLLPILVMRRRRLAVCQVNAWVGCLHNEASPV